jgi:hypothetical protein
VSVISNTLATHQQHTPAPVVLAIAAEGTLRLLLLMCSLMRMTYHTLLQQQRARRCVANVLLITLTLTLSLTAHTCAGCIGNGSRGHDVGRKVHNCCTSTLRLLLLMCSLMRMTYYTLLNKQFDVGRKVHNCCAYRLGFVV